MKVIDAPKSWYREAKTRLESQGVICCSTWLGWHFGWDIPRKIVGKSGFDGTNVFDKEWDLLVILDATRLDLLKEVTDNREDINWIEDMSSIKSVSGNSSGWMEETFTNASAESLSKTAYISGNPHTRWMFRNTSINRDSFARVEELWQTEWDDSIGTVPPRPVTDRGISVGRNHDIEKIILHYMQPHFPSIPNPIGSEMDLQNLGWEWSVWEQLKRGEVSKNEVWTSYKANLEYVLDDVELLLNNINTENAVVSSDHGNAMGERGYFGHNDWPVKEVQMVPWIETSTSDRDSYSPSTNYEIENVVDIDVESRLNALGYK